VIDLARGGAGDVEEVKYEEVKCAVGGPDATPPPNPGSECSSGDDSRYAFSSGGDFDPLDPGTEVEFARSDSRTDVENEGFDSGFLDFLDGVDVSGGYPNLDEVVGDMPDAVSGDFKGWEVDLVDSASHYRETMVGWPGGGSELPGGGSESSTGRKEKFIAQEDKRNQEVDTLLPDSQLATAISRTVHSTDSQRSSTLDEDRLLEPSIIEAADQQQGCTKVVVENRSAEAACRAVDRAPRQAAKTPEVCPYSRHCRNNTRKEVWGRLAKFWFRPSAVTVSPCPLPTSSLPISSVATQSRDRDTEGQGRKPGNRQGEENGNGNSRHRQGLHSRAPLAAGVQRLSIRKERQLRWIRGSVDCQAC
jgi:hypothetical protein